MSENTYSVYLIERQGSQGGQRQVTSPIEGTEVEFYDSGVWLTRETGRNFFPYDEIRTIREHPEGEGPGETGESGGDREDAGERDSGAEEDLVE